MGYQPRRRWVASQHTASNRPANRLFIALRVSPFAIDLALGIAAHRQQKTTTRTLNDLLQRSVQKHPPAGLKNTHPKLRYIVQTDTNPPWFVIYGSNLKFVHWSYKRYLERRIRDTYDYTGTPIKLSFRDEKQLKANRERVKRGLEPVTKAYKQAKDAERSTKR